MARRTKDSSLSSMSADVLRSELRRRERAAKGLFKKREKLMAKVAALDAQIREAGLATGGRGRSRDGGSLVAVMETVLKGKTLGVPEIVDSVLAAGYTSGAANFRSIVNQTLLKNKGRFKKVARGRYTLA